MIIHHITRRFVRESWGGTESAVLALAQQLQRKGHDTQILTTMALASTQTEDISEIRVSRHAHFYPYLGLTAADRTQLDMRAGNLFSYSLLRHMYTAAPADIYHLHTGKRMGGIVRVAARHHRRPYVISLHGGVSDVPADERARWTQPTRYAIEWGRVLGAAVGGRKVLHDASAIFCVNKTEQQLLQEQFPGKRVLWTPNTVDTNRYRSGNGSRFRLQHNIPAQAKVVLTVARIDEQKNQAETIRVFEAVADAVPEVWLVLAGAPTDAMYAARVQEAITASRHSQRILLLGNVDVAGRALVDMYHAADVFLLSSLHEPFGIVLLEAWAAGVPIVAPLVGGIPSFVDHGRTGLLFQANDTESATQHVISLLVDRCLPQSLRTAALSRVQAFDTDQSTQQLIEVYREVCHEHSLRA